MFSCQQKQNASVEPKKEDLALFGQDLLDMGGESVFSV